jgi:hypothetical protein
MPPSTTTPRALPARQFISLDTLVTRARGGAKVLAKSSPSAEFDSRPARRPLPRTLADLERDSSIANRFVRPPTPPSALVMWVLVATCDNCASVHRLPPQSILIRYGENEHSFHFKRADAALGETALALPREVREKPITLPFCEGCFK